MYRQCEQDHGCIEAMTALFHMAVARQYAPFVPYSLQVCCRHSLGIRLPLQIPYAVSKEKGRASKVSNSSKFKAAESDDEINDDPFEALFQRLEADLAKKEISDDENDDINDVAKLEKELDELFPDIGKEKHSPMRLEHWQLQKLASAMEVGRRKVSIKKLSSELGLRRDQVLSMLQNPPPQLLLLQPEKSDANSSEFVNGGNKDSRNLPDANSKLTSRRSDMAKQNSVSLVHGNQHSWHAMKRIKKVNLATLEKVYHRTRHPNDKLVDSIVRLTNLPRKTVVRWFIDRRLADNRNKGEGYKP